MSPREALEAAAANIGTLIVRSADVSEPMEKASADLPCTAVQVKGEQPSPRGHLLSDQQRIMDRALDFMVRQEAWEESPIYFWAKDMADKALPATAPARVADASTKARSNALDLLIERTEAPDGKGLAVEIDLALDRCSAFTGLFDTHRAAILADARRVGSFEA